MNRPRSTVAGAGAAGRWRSLAACDSSIGPSSGTAGTAGRAPPAPAPGAGRRGASRPGSGARRPGRHQRWTCWPWRRDGRHRQTPGSGGATAPRRGRPAVDGGGARAEARGSNGAGAAPAVRAAAAAGTADAGAAGRPAPPGPPGQGGTTGADVCARWKADRADLSEGTWTGDVASCTPGDIGATARANALRLVNLYRWLAALPAVVTDPTRDAAGPGVRADDARQQHDLAHAARRPGPVTRQDGADRAPAARTSPAGARSAPSTRT